MNRGRKNLFLVFGMVLCVTLWVGTDLCAQGGGPCAEDIAKLCKDVGPGGGRIVKCLNQHEKELSGACVKYIAESKARLKETAQACHDDAMNFCKDVKPGGGRILRCLQEHRNELSPECKERLAQPRKRH